MKKCVNTLLVAFLMFGIFGTASAAQYVSHLSSTLGAGDPCSGFGPGWETFASDATAGMSYCALYHYDDGVAEAVQGLRATHNRRCDYGGYEQFAYNGHSRLYFCMMKGPIASGDIYLASLVARAGSLCPSGYETWAYDGRSNIYFCARYARK